MIRIAQFGMNGFRKARTADEVKFGAQVPWIEIEGHRIGEYVLSATVKAFGDDVTRTVIEITTVEPVQIVYLDENGNEIVGVSSVAVVRPYDGPSRR